MNADSNSEEEFVPVSAAWFTVYFDYVEVIRLWGVVKALRLSSEAVTRLTRDLQVSQRGARMSMSQMDELSNSNTGESTIYISPKHSLCGSVMSEPMTNDDECVAGVRE